MWPPELVNSAAAASVHGATRSPSPGWPRDAGRPRVRATTGGLQVGAPGGGPPPRGSGLPWTGSGVDAGGSAAAGRNFPAAAHFLNPRPALVQGQGGGGDSLHIWPRRALPRADPLLRAAPGLDSATVTAAADQARQTRSGDTTRRRRGSSPCNLDSTKVDGAGAPLPRPRARGGSALRLRKSRGQAVECGRGGGQEGPRVGEGVGWGEG